MKILFLDQFAQIGGAQQCLLDLLPAFQNQKHELRFAVVDGGPFPDKLRQSGVRVDVLPGCSLSNLHKPVTDSLRYLRWYPKAARFVKKLGTDFRPDLLYVNGPRLLPPVALFAAQSRIPLLFHAHNRILQASALSCLGMHLRFAPARVIACCRYVADSLRSYVPPIRIETVYNGVPDMARRSRSSRPNDDLRIGVIGRIEPEKGQLEFVQAARLVNRELPACRFLIIGAPLLDKSEGYFHRVQAECRDLPVTMMGWQTDIPSVLQQLDLLVVPSMPHDATPRVIMEAFSAGTPVLAFRSGGIPEIIDDNRTGFLVNTRSPQDLAARLLQLLGTDRNAMACAAANARRKWEAEFQLETYRARICGIISAIRPEGGMIPPDRSFAIYRE